MCEANTIESLKALSKELRDGFSKDAVIVVGISEIDLLIAIAEAVHRQNLQLPQGLVLDAYHQAHDAGLYNTDKEGQSS